MQQPKEMSVLLGYAVLWICIIQQAQLTTEGGTLDNQWM